MKLIYVCDMCGKVVKSPVTVENATICRSCQPILVAKLRSNATTVKSVKRFARRYRNSGIQTGKIVVSGVPITIRNALHDMARIEGCTPGELMIRLIATYTYTPAEKKEEDLDQIADMLVEEILSKNKNMLSLL